jgi:hypothetical protein
MEILLKNDSEKDSCLSYIRFWVNSIISHTYSYITKSTAPIAFVGTRKDIVCDPSDQILYDSFSSSVTWPNVIENKDGRSTTGRTLFYFFPVNNLLGSKDISINQLMNSLDKVLDESVYTHKRLSLS